MSGFSKSDAFLAIRGISRQAVHIDEIIADNLGVKPMAEAVLSLLPPAIGSALRRLPERVSTGLQEVRIREGRPLEAVYDGGYCFVGPDGQMLSGASGAYVPTRRDSLLLLDLLTEHSLYAMEEQLKRGYITVRGGHRVGLSGRTVLENGGVKLMKDIAGFNVRLARERIGVSAPLLPLLRDELWPGIRHTLLISPPMGGKTTLLRDLVRAASCGEWSPGQRLKVGVVDERSEVAACCGGVPSFDLGPRTDVLDGCPKAEGMMMLIRSMSPQLIAVDELGHAEDAEAVLEAQHAGVRVVATAHGSGYEEALQRPSLRRLMEERVFTRILVLGGWSSGTLADRVRVLDENGKPVAAPRAAGGGKGAAVW